MSVQNTVTITKSYYNSKDADAFYHKIWGGEDIHVGIYNSHDESIFQASQRTLQVMVSKLRHIDQNTKILDIGAGYGGAARYLASGFQCKVSCLNLSEKQNKRNLKKNEEVGLSELIDVIAGEFEALPFEDNTFDIVWSQDAILHSGNKSQVFNEVYRVLKPQGYFIFTDPMQSDNCPEGVLGPILERIHLKEMASVKYYKQLASNLNMEIVDVVEMPEQLTNHYRRVQEELINNRDVLKDVCSLDYINRMYEGLTLWIEGGEKNYLNWGILILRK